MTTLAGLMGLGSGGGKTYGPILNTCFFATRVWTAPQNGIIIVRAMGAGGGGGSNASNATGGYSGSWGVKILRISAGTTVTVAIGAAGIAPTTAGNGGAGGDTTVLINGVTYTAYGGPGGLAASASAPPNGPSQSANWDFGAASVKPGWASGTVWSGGAGVDILAQGNNATTSSVVNSYTGGSGGGTVGAGTSTSGGSGGNLNATALGQVGSGLYCDAGYGEWGISFFGGSGGSYGGTGGGNGGGGGGSSGASAGGGGNGGGGGGGSYNSGTYFSGGVGGIGGGGGGGGTSGVARNGGAGYAFLSFIADMGI